MAFLSSGGHRVRRMVRGVPNAGAGELRFCPDVEPVDSAAFEGLDAVVHLAGENIAGRWSAERKRRIRTSRVEGTAALCRMLAALERPPKVLVYASAIGIYGSREGELLDESSEPGHGFLADLCRDWEAAAAPARDRGIRVVFARFGMVLSPRGGAGGDVDSISPRHGRPDRRRPAVLELDHDRRRGRGDPPRHHDRDARRSDQRGEPRAR